MNKRKPDVHVILCHVDSNTHRKAHPIARAAAVRALSGREMSARDVWEAMASACKWRGAWGHCGNLPFTVNGVRCHMGICPRLMVCAAAWAYVYGCGVARRGT